MSWVPSCRTCATAMPAAEPNYVDVDANLDFLCGDCVDATDEFLCDICCRVAETTYDGDDLLDDYAPLQVWPWPPDYQVCLACVWPLQPSEWKFRYRLTAEAAEIAAALAGEWAEDFDALAAAATALAGAV